MPNLIDDQSPSLAPDSQFGLQYPQPTSQYGAALQAILANPSNPKASDPEVAQWIRILSAPLKFPLDPGLLGKPSYPSSEPLQSSNETESSNPEIAYAGTLVGQLSDGSVRHCIYDRPGLGTFTVSQPVHQPCEPTAPAPRA